MVDPSIFTNRNFSQKMWMTISEQTLANSQKKSRLFALSVGFFYGYKTAFNIRLI